MKHVLMALGLIAGLASAAEVPRVVVQPLAATIPLPGAANAALLTTLAGMALELPSTFEVEDALAALPSKTCAEDVPCLAGLARATKSRWAMAVAFHEAEGGGVLFAKVVSAEGSITRRVDALALPAIPATEEAWAEAFRQLTAQLQLESLGQAPPAVAVTAPPVLPPVPAAAVLPPAQAERAAAPSSWKTPVAVVAGLVAVGAGGAATALALTNLNEVHALDTAMRSGLIPANAVDRAVALDERTVAATALGVGAGVAAAVALGALLMKDSPLQLAPAVGPGSAGLVFAGRLP